jgi:hypothetical protein
MLLRLIPHQLLLADVLVAMLTSRRHYVIILCMRTTLNLDDDVFQLVKTYAENRSLGMGKALSELVRRGLNAPAKTRVMNGLVVFDVPADSEPVTSELVKRLEAEHW